MFRLTNLAQPDATSSLPLPELEFGPKHKRSAANLLETFKQEKVLKDVVGMLQTVDVGYIRTRSNYVKKLEFAEGARGELLRHDSNIFTVDAKVEFPKLARRRTQAARTPQDLPKEDSNHQLGKVASVAKHKRKSDVTLEASSTLNSNKFEEAFQDFLDETFDQTDVVLDENGNIPQGEKEGRLTVSRLKRLNYFLEELNKAKKLSKYPLESLTRLVTLLDNHLRIGAGTVLNVDEEEDSDDFDNVLVSIDSCLSILLLLTAPDMPKKVYREEIIETIVEVVRHHTTHNVFVAYDAAYYQLYRGNDEADVGKKKRKSNPRAHMPQNGSAMKVLSSRLSVLYRRLAELSNVVRIQDSTMLSMCNTAIATMCVEDIQYLQLGALQVIGQVFSHYPDHRRMVFDELLNLLLKIPTGGRKLRMFSLAGEDNASIQMATALLLQCLQSCMILPDATAVTSIDDSDTMKAAESYKGATVWTSYFWQEFLKRFSSAKAQEVKFQLLIENFVSDVLTVYNQPEWPASQLLMQGLCIQLMGPYGLQSVHAAVRSMATDLLGKMLAKMRKDTIEAAADDSFWSLAVNESEHELQVDGSGEIKLLRQVVDASRRQVQWVSEKFNEERVTSDGAKDTEQIVLLRQVLLAHLLSVEAQQSDQSAQLAQQFLICHWTKEDSASRPVIIHCARLEEAKKTLTKQNELPHALAVRLMKWLTQQQPQIKQNYTSLLRRLMGMLEDPASAAREKVIKSLGSVFESDLGFLEDEIVQTAVERRLSDGAISVRRAVVELLGKCIELQPKFAERYYAAIVDRITDVGLSVRKCVLHILRECVQSPRFQKKIEALVRIMLRIRDSEPSIQEAVTSIFADRWLNPRVPIQERMQEFLDVNWQAYAALKAQGQVSLPLTSSFAPVDLLTRLIAMEETSIVNNPSTKMMCACLLEGVLCAKEASPAADETSNVSTKEIRVLPYVLALHALCVAEPSLCVPRENPLRFVRTLQPYLELSSPTGQAQTIEVDEAQQLQCILAIIDSVLSTQQDVPEALAAAIKENLETLIKRHPFHGVLFFTSRCICTLAATSVPARKTVTSLLKRFSGLLESCVKKISEQKIVVHVRRALFITGQLCRFGAKLIGEHSGLDPSEIVKSADVLKTFLKYMQPEMDLEMKCCALQAAGFVLITQPQLLLAVDGKMDKVMMESLKPSAHQACKEQALLNLCDMVREEETHMIKAQAEQQKAKAEGTQGEQLEKVAGGAVPTINGLGDNCISGGVIQRYWDDIMVLTTHPVNSSSKVRLKVLQLAEVVLRHGLVHPMSCIPMLMAMQCDSEKTSQRLAIRLMSQMYTQHSSFVTDRLADGIFLSFQFLKQFTQNGFSQDVREGLNNTYELYKNGRVSRNRFLSTVMRRFEDTRIDPESLRFMCFLADILASLNYSQLEEPLFVVHNLNRVISLRGSSIADSLKHDLASETGNGTENKPEPSNIPNSGGMVSPGISTPAPSGSTPAPDVPHTPAGEMQTPCQLQNTPNVVSSETFQSPIPNSAVTGNVDLPTSDPNISSPEIRVSVPLTDEQRKLQLQDDCNASVALSVMLLLKRHLRKIYALTDQRVQGFNPTEPPRGEAAVQMVEESLSLDQIDVLSAVDHDRIMKQYQLFKTLMKEDANDFAMEYKVVGKGKRTPGPGSNKRNSSGGRGKKRGRKGPEEGQSEGEEETGMEGDYQEFYNPAKRLAPMLT